MVLRLTKGTEEYCDKTRCQSRRDVLQQYCEEEKAKSKQRQEHVKCCYRKRKAMREKAAKEKELLPQQHLITMTFELKEALDTCEAISSRKKQRKLALLQMRIKIRKIIR